MGSIPGKFEQYFHALQNEKQTMADAFTVQTPDAHLNRMFNYWVKEQAMFGAAWCRWGWNGYRDIVQHGFGVSSIDPNRSREILLEAVQYQYASGLALRGWNLRIRKLIRIAPQLSLYLVHYLRETDDQSILWQSVPSMMVWRQRCSSTSSAP
ncbi:MAG: GH36-type glycosyl hydrolase domain-containing protein [Clostridia bacterium]